MRSPKTAVPPTSGLLRRALRWIGRRLFELVGIGLITLAVGEVASRAILGIAPLTTGGLLWEHHPRWGWRHRPGAEDTFVKLGARQHIRINSKGLREREIDYEKPPGVFRVLVLGDSTVVGFEVAPEDVFTRVAEDRLRQAGYPVEFINAGHRGWGTGQALLFLEDEGLRYRPDLVLYKWTTNDLDDNGTVHRPYRLYGKGYFHLDADGSLELRGVPVPDFPYTENLRVDEQGELVDLPVPWSDRLLLWLRDEVICRSAFATAVVHVAAAIPQLTRNVQDAGSYEDFSDAQRQLDRSTHVFRVTAAMIDRMRDVSHEAGAGFAMIAPWDRWEAALREELDLQDLGEYARFRRLAKGAGRTRVPFDTHWNELGHRLYGNALAEALMDSDLLPATRRGG